MFLWHNSVPEGMVSYYCSRAENFNLSDPQNEQLRWQSPATTRIILS
jgi:hypothetical protein